ncbi:hypothetical protein H2136_20495 [Aeromonas hydrophila]|uniref:Uncharacterized protein n=1 Tax=Aeromonas hydrophila TaxID=644 RepID=A0A926FMD5_AERHY|nr:hypothetical protein [Aeromonas hydrophila]
MRDLIRLACCWAMAPDGTADRGHHLVGDPVRRSGLKRGDRGQERAAVLQPLEVPRWPAAPASLVVRI